MIYCIVLKLVFLFVICWHCCSFGVIYLQEEYKMAATGPFVPEDRPV
ncbi:hypothetical protein Hanom_Chr09g00869561 [Helianthus anomalus]